MKWGRSVTPLVGVWIEIQTYPELPYTTNVTPLVGVWIEIYQNILLDLSPQSHSPCGSVD